MKKIITALSAIIIAGVLSSCAQHPHRDHGISYGNVSSVDGKTVHVVDFHGKITAYDVSNENYSFAKNMRVTIFNYGGGKIDVSPYEQTIIH